MKLDEYEIDPELKRQLDEFKPVPGRDPRSAARGRAQFLAEAAAWSKSNGSRYFIGQRNTFEKKRFASHALVTALVMFAILFGGTAGAVYAAQDDLPTGILYPIKTLTEDVRLGLMTDPQDQVTYLGQLANTRVAEMAALSERGISAPLDVSTRLLHHNQQAVFLTASMEDTAMQRTLERLRERLQSQYIAISQVDAHGDADQVMLHTRTALQSQVRLVETGLTDPQGFRNMIGIQNMRSTPAIGDASQTPALGGPGGQDMTPSQGSGYGPGVNATGTPTPDPGGHSDGTSGPGNGDKKRNGNRGPQKP